MTERQYRAWQEWLIIERGRPSRSDHYAMQTAMEVRGVGQSFSNNPPPLHLDQFRIRFTVKPPADETKEPTEKEMEGSRGFWEGYLGMMKAKPAKGKPVELTAEELEYWDKLFSPRGVPGGKKDG